MSGPTTAAPLSVSLRANPRLDRWLLFDRDGSVRLSPGKVEIGQGIATALAQIAADELDVDLGRIRLRAATTAASPNEGVTAGSLSIQDGGLAIRQVCAEARALFLAAAAQRLGVAVDSLTIADGTIVGPGNTRTSYGELADVVSLAVDVSGAVRPKPAAARRLVGTSAQRLDIPDKVFGARRFVHDLALPGLLHGRILSPPRPLATLDRLEETRARAVPGCVAVVRDGNVAGVIAESESGAETALQRLRADAVWTGGETLPDEANLAAWLKAQPVETERVDTRQAAAPRPVARTLRRQYTRPFLAHASIAPCCAVARWTDSALHVWTHSQGVYNLQAELRLVFADTGRDIVVEHLEGAGCYGHNGADDVALEAALLARAVPGRPVRLQWSRADELTRGPVGAAMAIEIEADLDSTNEIVAWRHTIWSNGHVSRPGRSGVPTLLASSQLAKPFPRYVSVNPPMATGGGAQRNAVPIYDFPAWEITSHRLLSMPLRVSSLRTLGAFGNVFAIESFLDELAAERGEDPLTLRRRHLKDERMRAVLDAATTRAGWANRRKADGVGYGLGCAQYKNAGAYCAVVAEIEAKDEVRVRRLVCAVDAGEVINPDGLANQVEGGAVQATSWTLKEAVRFDRTRLTSDSWETYPILRFSEVPVVEVEVIARPDVRPVGAGEAAHGPTVAAIANAVYDALGVRVRDLPITRDRLIAAMGSGRA
jgi:CO/xanthine dehydrogenase Mo-binding subunit